MLLYTVYMHPSTGYQHVVLYNPVGTCAHTIGPHDDIPEQLLAPSLTTRLTIHVLQTNMQQVHAHVSATSPHVPATMHKTQRPIHAPLQSYPASPSPSPPSPLPLWTIAITSNHNSALHTIRPLYETLLGVEQEGVVIRERTLQAGEDVCLTGQTCLCVLVPPAV